MKAKKIVSIVSVAILFVLALTVVISAIVPKHLNFDFAQPQSITIYKDGTKNNTIYYENDEVYKKVMELYNQGFKTSALSAFFQGKGFQKVTTIDSTKSLSSEKSGSNGIYIEFTFSEDQNVIERGVSTLTASEKVYRSVIFQVSNSNNLTQVNAYLLGTSNTDTSYVSYVSYAGFANLYDYLNNL